MKLAVLLLVLLGCAAFVIVARVPRRVRHALREYQRIQSEARIEEELAVLSGTAD